MRERVRWGQGLGRGVSSDGSHRFRPPKQPWTDLCHLEFIGNSGRSPSPAWKLETLAGTDKWAAVHLNMGSLCLVCVKGRNLSWKKLEQLLLSKPNLLGIQWRLHTVSDSCALICMPSPRTWRFSSQQCRWLVLFRNYHLRPTVGISVAFHSSSVHLILLSLSLSLWSESSGGFYSVAPSSVAPVIDVFVRGRINPWFESRVMEIGV